MCRSKGKGKKKGRGGGVSLFERATWGEMRRRGRVKMENWGKGDFPNVFSGSMFGEEKKKKGTKGTCLGVRGSKSEEGKVVLMDDESGQTPRGL